MPNFVNVGSQYILSNLDVKIPKLDSVLNVNTNGNIGSTPICRDFLKAYHDSTPNESIMTFGSLVEFGILLGSTSVFGGYESSWNLTNEWTNIGNTYLNETGFCKRTYNSLIMKRKIYGMFIFNGRVMANSDGKFYAWYRIRNNKTGKIYYEGVLPVFSGNYPVTFSACFPDILYKDDDIRFEMSCNQGGDIKVISTYAHVVALNLYEEDY